VHLTPVKQRGAAKAANRLPGIFQDREEFWQCVQEFRHDAGI
jgi:hypothetical protein